MAYADSGSEIPRCETPATVRARPHLLPAVGK